MKEAKTDVPREVERPVSCPSCGSLRVTREVDRSLTCRDCDAEFEENEVRRSILERLLSQEAEQFYPYLRRDAVMLDVIRYLQTLAPAEARELTDRVLGILPLE